METTRKETMMDKLINQMMTRLFQVAEYICNKYSFVENIPITEVTTTTSIPTIHFTNEEMTMIKPDRSHSYPSYAERKHTRPKNKTTEGELF